MLFRILPLIAVFCAETICSSRLKRDKSYDPRLFASCFDDIGCVDVTAKWYHEKWRPRNLEPLDRHTIRTEFLLMKKTNNKTNDLVYDIMSLKKETIEASGFKRGTCSIFIIHDFTSNGYTGWIKHMVLAFGRKTDCNIISIDWQAGAEPPFEQAISNARVVALEAKAFITLTKSSFNQSLENLHLVGHGVGAHIAGYVGKHIHGVQRITGLDPTGPFFAKMPKEVRLDADDAKYVEILHTDAFSHRSQGTKLSQGHADFVINNADHQPGCNDSSHFPGFTDIRRDSLQEGKILPACSHKRSFKYYIQALEDDNCQFIGIKCQSQLNFVTGKCNDCHSSANNVTCATFGLQPPAVTSRNNTFYLSTNGKKPFCMITYAVNITVQSGTTTRELEGYFDMIMVDENQRVTNASSNIYHKVIRKLETGHTYNFVFYGMPPCINKIKEAKVRWIYKSRKICIMCDKSIYVKEISIKRLSLNQEPSAVTNLICPVKMGAELQTGDYVEFQSCVSLYGPQYLENGHRQGSKKDQAAQEAKAAQVAQAAHAAQALATCDEAGMANAGNATRTGGATHGGGSKASAASLKGSKGNGTTLGGSKVNETGLGGVHQGSATTGHHDVSTGHSGPGVAGIQEVSLGYSGLEPAGTTDRSGPWTSGQQEVFTVRSGSSWSTEHASTSADPQQHVLPSGGSARSTGGAIAEVNVHVGSGEAQDSGNHNEVGSTGRAMTNSSPNFESQINDVNAPSATKRSGTANVPMTTPMANSKDEHNVDDGDAKEVKKFYDCFDANSETTTTEECTLDKKSTLLF